MNKFKTGIPCDIKILVYVFFQYHLCIYANKLR